jgi:hypothetical protein
MRPPPGRHHWLVDAGVAVMSCLSDLAIAGLGGAFLANAFSVSGSDMVFAAVCFRVAFIRREPAS